MLTEQQQKDVAALQQAVEAHDGIALKLNWSLLRHPQRREPDFILYRDGRCIGFLGVYAFGSQAELCGMVHPEHRRQGHFQSLYDRACAWCRGAGVGRLLLNTPGSSPAGQAFVQKQGARYAFSEHQMRWRRGPLPTPVRGILRPASPADRETEVRLDVEVFGVDEAAARAMYSEFRADPGTATYMIVHGERTAGRVRIHQSGGQAWIYGLAVFPEFQGRGLGRRALEAVIAELAGQGLDVCLEVETKNARAMHLYAALGFEIVQRQDYYSVRLDGADS